MCKKSILYVFPGPTFARKTKSLLEEGDFWQIVHDLVPRQGDSVAFGANAIIDLQVAHVKWFPDTQRVVVFLVCGGDGPLLSPATLVQAGFRPASEAKTLSYGICWSV